MYQCQQLQSLPSPVDDGPQVTMHYYLPSFPVLIGHKTEFF